MLESLAKAFAHNKNARAASVEQVIKNLEEQGFDPDDVM